MQSGIFKGVNFMTPNVLRREKLGSGLACELSTGTGIDNEKIYGVTFMIWRYGTWERCTKEDDPKSDLFFSMESATRYIAEMKEKFG